MSMWLMLAKIEVSLLEAVRADPQLIETLLWQDEGPLPEGLSAAFDTEADCFEADYRTLSAVAKVMPSKEWFDKATSGTESLDYDGFTYGPAFAFSPRDVSAVAAGLIAEGWHFGSAAAAASDDESDDAVQRSVQALGEAAQWSPEEIEAYGPMMAAGRSAEFNARVVQAIGSSAGWSSDTIARVAESVAAAEPEDLSLDDDDEDLAAFFIKAADQGRAVVGGIN